MTSTAKSSATKKSEKELGDSLENMTSLPFGARIDELEKMRKRRKKQINITRLYIFGPSGRDF